MKKRINLFTPSLVVLLVLCVGMTAVSWFMDRRLFYLEAALLLAALIYILIDMRNSKKTMHRVLTQMGELLSDTQRGVLTSIPLPVVVTQEDGDILWYNELFRDEVLAQIDSYGINLAEIAGIDHQKPCPKDGVSLVRENREYTVYYSSNLEHERPMKVFYFIEDTLLKRFAREYHLTRPSVAIILLDNYEELTQSLPESDRSQVLAKVETAVKRYFSSFEGFVYKMERDRYVCVLEKRHLDQMIQNRFHILDEVREISPNEKMPATLSIGLGLDAPSLQEAEHMARQALDMALGRGGDQAAVKTRNGYEFFGGVAKGVEKRTKVKTRIMASALIELIQNNDNVILMGHKFADLDCFGSAVGLLKAIKSFGKPAWIAIDRQKHLVSPLFEQLCQQGYDDAFCNPEDLMPQIGPKTLLIVVDTHLKHFVESEDLYRACKNVAVIDHHRKMVNFIDNAMIFYHEPFASSCSEMVAELLQYFGEKRRVGRPEAEALLAGIMLDTKNFVMRTGVRTFEAAAYLRRLGADTVEVKRLFASSMEEYQNRTKIMTSAEVYRHCAIAGTAEALTSIKLVAPQAADELLSISDVDASFVLYEYEGGVSFSARSLGGINVQIIMEKLGGGGHMTMAGAQMNGVAYEEARQALLEAIDEYYDQKNK